MTGWETLGGDMWRFLGQLAAAWGLASVITVTLFALILTGCKKAGRK